MEIKPEGETAALSVWGRRLVRFVFAMTVLLFLLQLVVVRRWGEFYPALMMPGFGGTGTGPDQLFHFQTESIQVSFADGSSTELSPNVLLEDAPLSHRPAMMNLMFRSPISPSTVSSRRANATLNWVLDRIAPARGISTGRLIRSGTSYNQTRSWLREQVGRAFPGQHARTISFSWYDNVYQLIPTRGLKLLDRKPTASYEIAL